LTPYAKELVPVEVLAVEPFFGTTAISISNASHWKVAQRHCLAAMNLFEQHRQQVAETESLLLCAPLLEFIKTT